jgi:YidC/Oxa1 family membrane protein insertase
MVASYLMFHYPKTDEVKPVPVNTLGERVWEVEEPTEDAAGVQMVRFHTTIPDPGFEHLKITKTYRLEPKAYHLGLSLEIEDTRPKTEGAESTKFRYQLTGAHGMPVEGGWYATTYRQALIGTVNDRNDLWRDYQDSMAISHTQGGYRVPEGQRGDSFLQYAAVATQFFASAIVVDNVQPSRASGGADMRSILAWARPTLESQEVPAKVQNIDVATNHLFVSQAGDQLVLYHLLPRVMDHLKELGILQGDKEGKEWTVKKGAPLVVSYYLNDKKQKVATWVREGQTPRGYFDDITVRVNSEKIELKPSEKVIHQFLLYHGPVKTRLLSQFPSDQAVSSELVERYTHTLHLRTLTDYRSPGPFGAISQKIMFTDLLILVTNLMHTLLYWLHFLVGGYGLAIILLTLIVRGLMFPISRKQALFAQKMQELAPELKKIQEKYKGDARGRTEATMEFYRKNRINPLGSCLPLLMQMPIFLGLYFALQESIHFRLAGFLWIENLAAPDMFLYWTQSIPWLSDPDNLGGIGYLGPYLNVLPLVAVFLMIAQQKLMTPPAQDEQQAAQQRMMRWMMILFGVMFYKVAAGLCIYFIVSSLWGVTERKLLPKKQLAAAGPTPSGQPPKPMVGGPKGKNPKLPPKPPETGFWAWLKNKWSEIQKNAEKK